ncbi:MAG: HAMP domain-containing sensor histidine kinase [Candidatus Aminicenantales bacterium]
MDGKNARRRHALLAGCAGAAALALIIALLSLILPRFIARNYDQKSLASLKNESRTVRREFARLLAAFESRKSRFAAAPLPAVPEVYFSLFKKAGLDTGTEGVALTNGEGNPVIWYGNVLSLIDLVPADSFKTLKAQSAAFLIRSKSSVYLVSLEPRGADGSLLAHFKLLAFIPLFQSSYILESHALQPAFHTEFDIDYWDFKQDVSGFEKLFARHNDGFAGQPRQENEIQTLFFPLRNEAGRILATVTLSSPSLTSKLTRVRESLWLILFLLLAAGALIGIVYVWTGLGFLEGRAIVPGMLILLFLAGLRFIAFPIGRLEPVRSLAVFSPAVAGFRSFWNLTQSPADILLTSLVAFAISACLAVYGKRLFRAGKRKPWPFLAPGLHLLAGAVAAGGLIIFLNVLKRLVFNSNVSLIRWTIDGPFLVLQLSLLLFLASLLLIISLAFRLAALHAGNRWLSYLFMAATAGMILFAAGGSRSMVLLVLHLALLSWVYAVVSAPDVLKRREVVVAGIILAALWTSWSLDRLTAMKTLSLMETTLKRTILNQEAWGDFLMEQSFPDIDRNQRSITAFFKNPPPAGNDFAHALWQKSLVAKFNWYSSLELRDAEGNSLSWFSLNVPKYYVKPPELSRSENWTVVRQSLSFIGKEKEFLIGYRDWSDETHYLGRLILYVSLDPEMLPFLYSANPYFEVLRTDPMPSLSQFDIGCAIYDLEGRPLFNPQKLITGIPAEDLNRLAVPGRSFWGRFEDKGTTYAAFMFRSQDRYCVLFTPLKKLKTRTVEFLRLFFFDLAVVAAVLVFLAVLAGKAKLTRPLWSFSNRVYAAFLAVALIPLVMYTVFTRSLFDRVFTERFVEDAAIHASYAQSLMEAFLIVGDKNVSPYLAPTADLALWISSTLSNDVNLYQDAILQASSRLEFFDSGLLPDLLDGEAYEGLVYEKKPFFTKRTSVGGYSFQTLTVPYEFQSSTLFISLPFPFEQEEVARATREIVEFLVLLAAFFSVLVILFSRGIRSMIIVPVRKLLAGTREVGLGNLEVRIDHRSSDEMMTLIDGFNTMIKNLKAHEQELAEMSKKVAWTEMARKVAHEIKNPLTPIQLSAEHVLKVYEDKKGDFDRALKESMSYIISEVDNLRRIAQEFMEISRDTTLRKDPLDLAEVLEDTLRPYRKLLSERIRFKVVYAGRDFRTRGDAAKLKTALRNVVANAVEAISQKGEVAVTMVRDGLRLRIAIRDTGPGMSRETIERIFDPYFSTKDAGTGLGLPIAKKIIEEHGGTIQVASEPGGGTTVTMEFPVEE